MVKTPDRFPGTREEDELQLLDQYGVMPDVEGGVVYSDGSFYFKDAYGEFNPRSGGGISESQHKSLRQLIHFIDGGPALGFLSGAYREMLPAASPFITQIIWWESAAKLKKILEKNLTLNAQKNPTTIEWKMYDTDGSTVIETVVDTISYSTVFELSRTRTIS